MHRRENVPVALVLKRNAAGEDVERRLRAAIFRAIAPLWLNFSSPRSTAKWGGAAKKSRRDVLNEQPVARASPSSG